MQKPFSRVREYFNSEEERDKAYNRKLLKDFMIATHQRVIKKITHRQKGQEPLYGYEVKRA